MATCQDSCPSCPGEVCQQCQLCAVPRGSLCPPGDAEQVGSAWMGTLWPHSCCSVPLSALLGHSEPEACSSDVSSCVCPCCSSGRAVKSSCSRLSPSLVLQLGTSCSSPEPGQLPAAQPWLQRRGAAHLWLQGRWGEPFSVLPGSSSCTSPPGRVPEVH